MRRKIKTIVFIILLIFYNAREKMFTNSVHCIFAAWDVFSRVFSETAL